MSETIQAVFKDGKFEPLEKVDLSEGDEVTISLVKPSTEKDSDAFHEAAGAWKDIVDCDKLIEDVYTSRLIQTRNEYT